MSNSAPYDPLAGLKRGIWDRICPQDLPPVPTNPPPWGGDSCACVQYTVETRSTGPGLPPISATSIPLTGPIYGIERETPTPGAQSSFIRHGICTNGQFSGTNRTQAFFGNENYTTSIVRINRQGSGTNCPVPSPTPPPSPTPIPPEDQQRSAPITIAPNVSLTVPVILVRPTVNIDLNPSVEINVGPLNFNFDLGGVTIGINPSFNPRIFSPEVNLPGLPGGNPRPPVLPPAGGGGVCPDPCEPIELETITVQRIACPLENGEYDPKTETSTVQVLKGEKDAWELLFKQFLPSNERICETKDPPDVGMSLIGSGSATISNRVFYFPVGKKVVSALVRIVAIGNEVSLYTISTPNEEQGKFGNIALCVPGPAGRFSQFADPGWLWCRDTWYQFPSTDLEPRQLRLAIAAGISFEVYDTGERV